MNEHKNHVGYLSKSIKKSDQDLENIRFYSLGWPTEKQSLYTIIWVGSNSAKRLFLVFFCQMHIVSQKCAFRVFAYTISCLHLFGTIV